MAMQPLLVTVLALGSLLGNPNTDESVPSRLRVVMGRVSLENAGAREAVSRSDGQRVVRGAAALEVGTGARVELRWDRVMSLNIQGPAELSWRPSDVEGGAPSLRIESARRLEWEVRSGDPTVELSQGWRIVAERGAYWMGSAADGGVDLGNHGGADLKIRTLVQRTPGTWPSRLTPGQRVRLCAAPTAGK